MQTKHIPHGRWMVASTIDISLHGYGKSWPEIDFKWEIVNLEISRKMCIFT
jgi:hypothetical protein